MTVLLSYGYRHDGFNVPPSLACVADDTHVGYVGEGSAANAEMDLRAEAINERYAEEFTSASDWLRVGVSNFGYLGFTDPIQVDTFEDGMAQADTFLDNDTSEEQGT